MSDEAMSDKEFEEYDENDDFAGRRLRGLFDIDDDEVEDEDSIGGTGDEDETVSEEPTETDLSQEYPSMKDLPEKDEPVSESDQDLSEEYPTMNEEKKIVSPDEWTLDDEYPSMKDLKKS